MSESKYVDWRCGCAVDEDPSKPGYGLACSLHCNDRLIVLFGDIGEVPTVDYHCKGLLGHAGNHSDAGSVVYDERDVEEENLPKQGKADYVITWGEIK